MWSTRYRHPIICVRLKLKAHLLRVNSVSLLWSHKIRTIFHQCHLQLFEARCVSVCEMECQCCMFLKETKGQRNCVNGNLKQAHSPLSHNSVTLGDIQCIYSISLPGWAHFRRFFFADIGDLILHCPSWLLCRMHIYGLQEEVHILTWLVIWRAYKSQWKENILVFLINVKLPEKWSRVCHKFVREFCREAKTFRVSNKVLNSMQSLTGLDVISLWRSKLKTTMGQASTFGECHKTKL